MSEGVQLQIAEEVVRLHSSNFILYNVSIMEYSTSAHISAKPDKNIKM